MRYSTLILAIALLVCVGCPKAKPELKVGIKTDGSMGVAPFVVRFNARSTQSFSAWAWNFGDGATSDDENPTHAYQQPGVYSVSLTAHSGADVAADFKQDLITVTAAPVLAQEGMTINWLDVTKDAPWAARKNASAESLGDQMFLFAGSADDAGCFNDVWSSPDGMAWTEVTDTAPWAPRQRQSSCVFDGKIWMFGGVGDNYTTSFNDVWATADGTAWTEVAAHAQWSPRYKQATVVFKDRMWILGGNGGFYGQQVYALNDIWSSADGVTWQQETANAPWRGRFNHSAVVFNGEIWILAGVNGEEYLTDVWHSPDGIAWTQSTGSIPWEGRSSFIAGAADGKLFISQGMDFRKNFREDSWETKDGHNWQKQFDSCNSVGGCEKAQTWFEGNLWTLGGLEPAGVTHKVQKTTDVICGFVASPTQIKGGETVTFQFGSLLGGTPPLSLTVNGDPATVGQQKELYSFTWTARPADPDGFVTIHVFDTATQGSLVDETFRFRLIDNGPPIITVGLPSLTTTDRQTVVFPFYSTEDPLDFDLEAIRLTFTGTARAQRGVQPGSQQSLRHIDLQVSGTGSITMSLDSGFARDFVANRSAPTGAQTINVVEDVSKITHDSALSFTRTVTPISANESNVVLDFIYAPGLSPVAIEVEGNNIISLSSWSADTTPDISPDNNFGSYKAFWFAGSNPPTRISYNATSVNTIAERVYYYQTPGQQYVFENNPLPGTNSLSLAQDAVGLYVPGQVYTVRITLDFDGAAHVTAVGLVEKLPPGWQFVDAANGAVPQSSLIEPSTGNLNLLWITIPNFPASFDLHLRAPNSASGDQILIGEGVYRLDGSELSTGEIQTTLPAVVSQP